MARFVVNVTAGVRTVSLLIVLSSDQFCSALLDDIKKRLPSIASKLGLVSTDDLQITLHLNTQNGPILDIESLLSELLLDANEIICAVIEQDSLPQQSSLPPENQGKNLRVRVITPEIAQSHSHFDSIKPLPRTLSLTSTLRDLKGIVQEHLGFPFEDGIGPELECNCSLARQIDQNATVNERAFGYVNALQTVVVVYGNNQVDLMPIDEPTRERIIQAAKDHFPSNATTKVVNAVGGLEQMSNLGADNVHYLKNPVVAICSKERHKGRQRAQNQDDGASSGRELVLDIHSSECPIEVTSYNADVTLSASGLEDCVIDGVLNIFAVQRWSRASNESNLRGKIDIFKNSEAWEHHVGQTDRGTSNILSTLRVFTDLTKGDKMELARQDAVLHVLYLLTRFPPAVRAAYILMRGETPRPSERAALSQCIYEILKMVVPLQIVQSDARRFYEGTRLLFGLILEKAKNLRVSSLPGQPEFPYLDMNVYDLRNMITMDTIQTVPVQTKAGLVDIGFFEAFEDSGLLRWTNSNDTSKVDTPDSAWSRVATITGGTKAQVVVFNMDTVRSSRRYIDGFDISKIIFPAEYNDLHYLANLCSRNHLMVVPPADLASASPPVLTLDREGYLAVYVGREGCGTPGKDILMFRPTSNRDEEGVDVSIITGLLEPILAERTADGTIVFEAYGDYRRKVLTPEEIIILCVDLSCSMSKRCGFDDVESNEDANVRLQRDRRTTLSPSSSSPALQENPAFHLLDADELKEYLRAHESFDDFLTIINTGGNDFQRSRNAEKVIQILEQLDKQQIDAKEKDLHDLRRRASHYVLRTRMIDLERDLHILRNRLLRLQKHKTLLCAWFLTCISSDSTLPNPLSWKPGDAIPRVYKPAQETASGPTFEIPREYCCHISNEIMEDPVITVDDFTYERRNIERWFQTNETSPLTNLVLPSLDLRANVQKKEEIRAFLSGSDILSRYGNLLVRSQTIAATFKSPLNIWTMALPRGLKLEELWEIAFRLTKGRYMPYELQCRNTTLPATQDPIHTVIDGTQTVFITPIESTNSGTGSEIEELCLVKVYDLLLRSPTISYWESKKTTKSLASVVFRFYRQKFLTRIFTSVEEPFVFWTKMRDTGDNHRQGTIIAGHWERISEYFNQTDSTGNLNEEPFSDKISDAQDSDEDDRISRPNNQPLVFKIALGPPRVSTNREHFLSRLDVLKQMFDAFINRILAYNFQTHIGLVKFSSKASVSQKLTHAVENFRHKMNDMVASGDTALWDSIALAQDQLVHYAEKYPEAKLRIICISDGEDNKSRHTALDLASGLLRGGIIVDSFCLGNAQNEDLQALSYLSGGLTFKPETLEEAMAICEMEPVLSVLQRPELQNSRLRIARFRSKPTLQNFRRARIDVRVERVTRDVCPKRKEHPGLRESFIELGHVAKSTSQVRTDSNVRLSRIHNEIRNSSAKTHPHYDIYVCESNMGLWKVVMQGPPESTYVGGTFLLYVEMGENYPMFPPQARFITQIYHPNINRHGRICHSILDRNWTVDTSTKDVIDTIYSLLLVPEFSDPVNTVVTLDYHWDEVQFKEEAQRHLAKHASKTREEWRKEIMS